MITDIEMNGTTITTTTPSYYYLHKDKSEYQEQRAVSGHMINDIEMNGTTTPE